MLDIIQRLLLSRGNYSTARGICPVVALRYEADALHDRGSYLEEQDGFPLGKKYFPRTVGGLT